MIYPCQRCDCDVQDGPKRVPGAVQMGRSMMEQMVCAGCQSECCKRLDDEVWQERPTPHIDRCNLCGGGFGAEGQYYAHRRPTGTGEWVVAPLCHACFARYKECCTRAMKHGG